MLIQDKGLNFAGIRALMSMIPCWAMRDCSEEDRNSCQAYSNTTHPCWEASKKGRKCRNENCRTCDVYISISNELDLKSVIKTLI